MFSSGSVTIWFIAPASAAARRLREGRRALELPPGTPPPPRCIRRRIAPYREGYAGRKVGCSVSGARHATWQDVIWQPVDFKRAECTWYHRYATLKQQPRQHQHDHHHRHRINSKLHVRLLSWKTQYSSFKRRRVRLQQRVDVVAVHRKSQCIRAATACAVCATRAAGTVYSMCRMCIMCSMHSMRTLRNGICSIRSMQYVHTAV